MEKGGSHVWHDFSCKNSADAYDFSHLVFSNQLICRTSGPTRRRQRGGKEKGEEGEGGGEKKEEKKTRREKEKETRRQKETIMGFTWLYNMIDYYYDCIYNVNTKMVASHVN